MKRSFIACVSISVCLAFYLGAGMATDVVVTASNHALSEANVSWPPTVPAELILTVRETAGIARSGEIVRSGVPLPRPPLSPPVPLNGGGGGGCSTPTP
jgi:hypothetical protein